ncbi:MAG TPA: endonuclease/exonuclease/phosphatase family protein [Nocardioides sp.]|nr:endonuclease/exonuclease/phosphatase family protein [Nocardioides sp.]
MVLIHGGLSLAEGIARPDPGAEVTTAASSTAATTTRWPQATILPPPVIQSGGDLSPAAEPVAQPPGIEPYAVPFSAPLSAPVDAPGLAPDSAPDPAPSARTATPASGSVTASVANLPNRTSPAGFASSLRSLTADGSDFVMLNEVSRRSIDGIRSAAPGYDAWRDPAPDRSTGGSQSMNNVVMWRSDRWSLVDSARVKVVDDDRGYLHGHAFTWDRYATWAMLERDDGAIVSVVSTHMPTNPGKYPRQPGNPSMSRVERYSRGMDTLVATVQQLAQHGPVLVGGDMNSHHSQGAWTAAAKMTRAGYRYVKDRGVMHLFYPSGADVARHRQLGVASDHPAIVTTLVLEG